MLAAPGLHVAAALVVLLLLRAVCLCRTWGVEVVPAVMAVGLAPAPAALADLVSLVAGALLGRGGYPCRCIAVLHYCCCLACGACVCCCCSCCCCRLGVAGLIRPTFTLTLLFLIRSSMTQIWKTCNTRCGPVFVGDSFLLQPR